MPNIGKNIWYAYQEWIDKGIASVVPESADKIEASDRAAVLLSVPLALFGCAPAEEAEGSGGWMSKPDISSYEPDTYVPPQSKDTFVPEPDKPDTKMPPDVLVPNPDTPDSYTPDSHTPDTLDSWSTEETSYTPDTYTADTEEPETYLDAADSDNGSDESSDEEISPLPLCVDKDKDGYGEDCELGADCDDTNSQIFSGAFEFCNGKDDNCDGQKDENYSIGESCTVGVGLCENTGVYICTPNKLDSTCNVTPLESQKEIPCDGIDQDCNGSDLLGTDLDGDGYPIKEGSCGEIDCNDTDPKIHPNASDICNNVDDDCDGQTDDAYAVGDSCTVGVGLCENTGVNVCAPNGLAVVCNVTPLKSQKEIPCDDIDQDCNGSDFAGTDKDGDGYKIEGGSCGAIDCSDANPQIFPGAFEFCNNKDDNCDGQKDDGYDLGKSCEVGIGLCVNSGKSICSPSGTDIECDAKPFLPQPEIACDDKDQDCNGSYFMGTDADGDGYKIEGGACGAIDCDDTESQIFPGAFEFCNGKNDDCDGGVDENYNVGESCTEGIGACENTGAYICNKNKLETICGVTPLKPQKEIPCDGIDQDCNGSDFTGTDKDGDGYKIEGGACGAVDCDDSNPQIFPGAFEFCNGKDDDCEGGADENYNIGEVCEVGIGLCVNSGIHVCSPSGIDTECDAKPFQPQPEIGCDGIDQDCDGNDFQGTDADGDGYKIEGGACGTVDCDDTNPQIFPGAFEFCNNKDDNCSGGIDENYNVGESCTEGIGACENTGAYVCASNQIGTTCNVAPFEPQNEVPCDDIDQDCNGSDFAGTDVDTDGYTVEGGFCGAADCNDNNANIHPKMLSEAELGLANDGIDNNCDGYVDEIDIDGIELTLSNTSGYHGYIHISNGGKLKLTDAATSWTTGDLTVDAGSVLNISGVTCGSGNGYAGGGSYDGGGGSGASHVKSGGSGGYGGWAGYGFSGGPTYGSFTDLITESGSCGGNGGGNSWAAGGMGGGAISITTNNAYIYGAIYANGKKGDNAWWDDGGGGGGSGGGILISANTIYVDTSTSELTVKGGDGGSGGSYSASGGGGGGGGAGGTIELLFNSAVVQGAIYEVYGSEFCCGFANRLLEYGIAQSSGGFGGGPGCGSSKCGQWGGNGENGAVNNEYF